MECDPIDATIVTLKNELDDGIGIPEHICLLLVCSCHLILEAHGCWSGVFLAQT